MGLSDQPESSTRWCRWIVQHPILIFAIGLVVHLMFLVVTGVLFATKYPILPLVFDDLPLQMNDEVMYLRTQAWSNRNNDVDPSDESSRKKRNVQYVHQVTNDILVDLTDISHYFGQPELLLAPVLENNGFKPGLAYQGHGGFLNDDDIASAHDFLNSVDTCCSLSEQSFSFSKSSCVCDPNSRLTRLKRDDEDEVEEREFLLTSLRLIYEDPDGNVFTKENLQKIAKFEFALYNLDEFQTKYCRLFYFMGTRHCQPFNSILRFFDGSFKYAHDDLYDPSMKNVTGLITTAFELEETEDAIKYYISKNSNISSKHGIARSDKTRSLIFFGYPLKRFGNDTENRGEQQRIWTRWAKRELVPLFMNYYHKGIDGLTFHFMSYTLYWREVLEAVLYDWIYIVGGFCFIFIFMWFQTGSLWITGWGLCSIVTSFFGANLIYNLIIDFKFFGIFNVLALFILLGIGADDIFIFSDTWRHTSDSDFKSLEHRMSVVFKRAAIAMLVTSITTMVAFFVNSFSPLLPVAAFGTFSGLIILVNYISVITFFPAVVMVHHKYFKKFCCCCCCDQSDTTKVKERITLNDRVVTFFRTKFFSFVTNRIAAGTILVLFGLLVGTAVYLATTIKLADETFQLFAPGTQHEVARDHDMYSFLSTDLDPKIEITIAWGLKPQDRTMCPVRKYDALNPCDGKTVWDTNFDLNTPEAQMALLEFCNKLSTMEENQNKILHIAHRAHKETGRNNVTCFIQDMAAFFQVEGSQDFYPAGTNLSLPITREKMNIILKSHPNIYKNDSHLYMTRPFEMAVNFWMTHRYTNETIPDKRRDFRTYLGHRRINKNYDFSADEDERTIRQTKLMYVAVQVLTDAPTRALGLSDGLKLMDNWEKFMQEELNKMPDALRNGFQVGNIWFWYKIIQTLATQSIIACITGLLLAFVVIFLGTTNIITGLVATFLLSCVTICVIGVIPLAGWKFGLLEALNLCLVVGLAVDYIVHLSEGYHMSVYTSRLDRVRDTLEKVGISVMSGAITTLGASFFMLFAQILFFKQFGLFIFATIGFSMIFSLFVLMAFYSLCGPEGYTGSFLKLCKKRNKYQEEQLNVSRTSSRNTILPSSEEPDIEGDGTADGRTTTGMSNPALEKENTEL